MYQHVQRTVRNNRPLVVCTYAYRYVSIYFVGRINAFKCKWLNFIHHINTHRYNQFIQNDVFDKYFIVSFHFKKLFKSLRNLWGKSEKKYVLHVPKNNFPWEIVVAVQDYDALNLIQKRSQKNHNGAPQKGGNINIL